MVDLVILTGCALAAVWMFLSLVRGQQGARAQLTDDLAPSREVMLGWLPIADMMRAQLQLDAQGQTRLPSGDGGEAVVLSAEHELFGDMVLVHLSLALPWDTPAQISCHAPGDEPLRLADTTLTWRTRAFIQLHDEVGEALWDALGVEEVEGVLRRLARLLPGALTRLELTRDHQRFTFAFEQAELGGDYDAHIAALERGLSQLRTLAPGLITATRAILHACGPAPSAPLLARLVRDDALGMQARLEALELLRAHADTTLYDETLEALLPREHALTLVYHRHATLSPRFAAQLSPEARLGLSADGWRALSDAHAAASGVTLEGLAHDGLMAWSDETIEAVGFATALDALSRAPLGLLPMIRHAARKDAPLSLAHRALLRQRVGELTPLEVRELLDTLARHPREEDPDALLWIAPVVEDTVAAQGWWRALGEVTRALGRRKLEDAHVQVIAHLMRYGQPSALPDAVALILRHAQPSHIATLTDAIARDPDAPSHAQQARQEARHKLLARFADQLNAASGGLSLAEAEGGELSVIDPAEGALSMTPTVGD